MSKASTSKSGKISFDDYKSLKNEIIEISEQRFENILTKRLEKTKKDIIHDISGKFDLRFDIIETKYDARFNSLEKRMTFLTWFLPVLISVLLTLFKVI